MVGRLFSALGSLLREHTWDLLALAGLLAVAGGMAWLWHPGAGLIVAGAGILALSVFASYVHRQ